MNYKILIFTGLIFIAPIYTYPITLDPSIKKAVHSFVRLSGVAAGLFASTKLLKRKWDAQCKWVLGIFGVGIASFFYKLKFNRAQQFIINDRHIHPDLKNNSPTRTQIQEKNKPSAEKVELIKFPLDQAAKVRKILMDVAQIKALGDNPYENYAIEFCDIYDRQIYLKNEKGDMITLREGAIRLSPQEFVRYVLPCYNPPEKRRLLSLSP